MFYNMYYIPINILVFQFDISGIDIIEEHRANIFEKFLALFVFHLDISGNDFKEEQP